MTIFDQGRKLGLKHRPEFYEALIKGDFEKIMKLDPLAPRKIDEKAKRDFSARKVTNFNPLKMAPPRISRETASFWTYGSQFFNNIWDQDILYYLDPSFKKVKKNIEKYQGKDLRGAEYNSLYKIEIFPALRGAARNPSSTNAVINHWNTYATDGPGEESMNVHHALRDRSVDCEEHADEADLFLTLSDYCKSLRMNMYDEESGHATKIVDTGGNLTTVDNWGRIDHFTKNRRDVPNHFYSNPKFAVLYTGSLITNGDGLPELTYILEETLDLG